MSTRYEVEYYYYQHNSGAADNGNYTKRYPCSTLSEANDLVRRINHARTHRDIEEPWDIEDKLIPYSGYFTEPPVIFELTERKIE